MTYTCEHGLEGCLMPGPHLPEECHNAEMMERQAEYDQQKNKTPSVQSLTIEVSSLFMVIVLLIFAPNLLNLPLYNRHFVRI